MPAESPSFAKRRRNGKKAHVISPDSANFGRMTIIPTREFTHDQMVILNRKDSEAIVLVRKKVARGDWRITGK